MQEITIESLKKNSGLPGPRANLGLLDTFIRDCDQENVQDCLSELKEDTENSPEEFVGMCGVVGYSMLNWRDDELLVGHLRKYAIHRSWRVREAVAIAIQEIPFDTLEERTDLTRRLESIDPLVNRAIVAGLCEPRNLKKQVGSRAVIDHLQRATALLDKTGKLTTGEESLKKALGYCWSVALVEDFEYGSKVFESLFEIKNKSTKWIIQENLKKNRLQKKYKNWVEERVRQLTKFST